MEFSTDGHNTQVGTRETWGSIYKCYGTEIIANASGVERMLTSSQSGKLDWEMGGRGKQILTYVSAGGKTVPCYRPEQLLY